MDSDEKTRHVTARVCVEHTSVLMRIVEQRGIARWRRGIVSESTPLIAECMDGPEIAESRLYLRGINKDHDNVVSTLEFETPEAAREHARKIFETVNALNGQPKIPNEKVPCKRCGRPPVLFEYSMRQARWAVRCRDVDCGNGVNAPIISEAWGIWAADNRTKLAVPAFKPGVWYTIGGEE